MIDGTRRGQPFERDAAGPPHDRRRHRAVDDRRLDADVGVAGVEHEIDGPVEVGEHVCRRRRAGPREAIGARRRHRDPRRGQQRQGDRMRRHAHGDGGQAGGHRRRHRACLGDDHRERPGPERLAEPGGERRHLGGDLRRGRRPRRGGRSSGRSPAGPWRRRCRPPPPDRAPPRRARRPSRSGTRPGRRRAARQRRARSPRVAGACAIDAQARRLADGRHAPIVARGSAGPTRRRSGCRRSRRAGPSPWCNRRPRPPASPPRRAASARR